MSVDRKLWNATLSALMLTQAACGVAVRPNPEATKTPIASPTKSAETPIDIAFVQTSCDKGGIVIPQPIGWNVLEVQISPTSINCYVSKTPINKEEDFRSGLQVSKFAATLPEKDKIDYAKQLASQPQAGLLPQANTFKETRVGSFRIFSGRFTTTRNNLLQDQEIKVILPDGSTFIYILRFSAPKPTSADDFSKYGRNMLDGITINGLPTN